MVFGWSKREKVRGEIQNIERILSDLSYTINYINSELSREPKSETEVRAVGTGILALIDRIISLRWNLFTVENIRAAGFDVDQTNGFNELHNNAVYEKEKGYLRILQDMKNAVNAVITNLTSTSEQLKRSQQDTTQHAKAQQNYMQIISALKTTLTSIAEDLTNALEGENPLLCGIRYYNQPTKIIRVKKPLSRWKVWAARAALASALMSTAGFTAASPTARSGVVSVVKSPIQNIRIGTLGIFSVESLQEKVDEINNKIKRKEKLSDEEVDFLKALYQVIATGGSFTGLPIAGQLLNHYVNGEGANLEINPEIYTNCPAVQEAMRRMREYIEGGIRRGALSTQGRINSTDKKVRKALKGRSRDNDYQNSGILRTGFIKSGVADSKPTFYANRRFPLTASYSMQGDQLVIDWSVTDVYDFRDKGNMSTLIPMPGGKLKLWDRISCAIATTAEGSRSLDPFGHEFTHTAKWTTVHRGEQPEIVASNTAR